MLYLTKERDNRSFIILQALEEVLDILGERTRQSMIFELRMRAGIHFEDPSLSLEKVYKGFAKLYGEEVAEIIMEDVILRVEKIASEKTNSA